MNLPDNLPEKLDDTLALLAMLDRGDRIQMLIDIADRFQEVPANIAIRPFDEAHKVPACESEAYAWAAPRPDDTLDFHFAVENPQGISAKAMAVILRESLSGAPLDQVASLPGDVIYEIFGRELSMGKSMGLMGMVSMVALSAKKAAAKNSGKKASTEGEVGG